MTRYRGNQWVGPGVYFNLRQMAFKSLQDEGYLPGTQENEYRRVPAVALLMAGPLLGLVYVIFLPLIGFGMLAWVATAKAIDLVARAAVPLVRVLKPVWEPAMAFFSKGRPAPPNNQGDTWTKTVRKEMEEQDDRPE